MILYKYVPYGAGFKILKNNNIGFSQPHYFNDPFELEASYPSENIDNPVDAIFNGRWRETKKELWRKNTAVLSLTRQPLNPLMWSHYSESHKGFVIGLDASIKEFTCEKSNLVPVQYGNVIYTNKKPDAPFLSTPTETLEVGGTFHFPRGAVELLQRKFLFKPACWSYEEEVRVVKCIKGIDNSKNLPSGSFSEIEVGGRSLYLLHLPEGTIKEVYAGVNSEIMKLNGRAKDLIATIKRVQPDIKVFGCAISKYSWELERIDLEGTVGIT